MDRCISPRCCEVRPFLLTLVPAPKLWRVASSPVSRRSGAAGLVSSGAVLALSPHGGSPTEVDGPGFCACRSRAGVRCS
ncbi:MAG: hypothetical protein HY078_13705 [Elusimicrobia bacterium]|nr:hypothetical protein [Elusimicrobiota bacterium]